MILRAFQRGDFDQWNRLWQANNDGQARDNVTAETWRRLLSPKDSVHGIGIWDGDTLNGFLHYILHPVTGHIEPACYMQDLYVDEVRRRQGNARRLIRELQDEGQKQKWARIYWLAEGSNIPAQNLYKTLGIKVDFTLHILPTQQ